MALLQISQIEIGDLPPVRTRIDEQVVSEYLRELRVGQHLAAVTVFHDGVPPIKIPTTSFAALSTGTGCTAGGVCGWPVTEVRISVRLRSSAQR